MEKHALRRGPVNRPGIVGDFNAREDGVGQAIDATERLMTAKRRRRVLESR